MAVCSFANKWTVRSLLIVVMVMLTNIVEPMAAEVNVSGQQEKEIELKLKQFNKQPLKSIQGPNGETIDCISITEQPAFDDPMLKNHTIQMKPSSYPTEVFTDDDASTPNNDKGQQEDMAQIWQFPGDCPENTIPVRRITKEDLLRASKIENYGKKISDSNISDPHQVYQPTVNVFENGHEFAITYLENGSFQGALATINIWKPRVQRIREYSESQIWVVGDKQFPGLNSLEAGWHVHPELYGDVNPRLFIYWTRDGYQSTGCYNLLCPGFVHTNRRIPLGGLLNPYSTYDGPQYDITVKIWKDAKTGNWWLQMNDFEAVGYWPSSILPNLRVNAANKIKFGGEVLNFDVKRVHTTTQMGSGSFGQEGFRRASFFRGVKIVDASNVIRDPVGLQTFATKPTCYDVFNVRKGKSWGVSFYYGGNGYSRRCQF